MNTELNVKKIQIDSVSDECVFNYFTHFTNFTHIELRDIHNSLLADETLLLIAQNNPNLQSISLELCGTNVTTSALQSLLAQSTQLTSMCFTSSDQFDLANICAALPTTNTINHMAIKYHSNMLLADVYRILDALPNLKSLTIQGCRHVNNVSIEEYERFVDAVRHKGTKLVHTQRNAFKY